MLQTDGPEQGLKFRKLPLTERNDRNRPVARSEPEPDPKEKNESIANNRQRYCRFRPGLRSGLCANA
jgi:hypothetical protein